MDTASIAILATGAEAEDAARILEEHLIPCLPLKPSALPRALEEEEIAAVLLAADTIPLLDLALLDRLVEAQPACRDFSFILLADRGCVGDLAVLPSALGNLVLLERPLVPAFLVHSARAALRSHARQLCAQEQIRVSDSAEDRLRQVTETLETRVRERMRELRRLQAELIHISRVSAMGTMASTLAHELNQPLTAVSSYISGSRRLLEDPADGRDQAREALRAAEGAALRAGQILRRLREFVSRGNVSVKPERLATLVQEACDLGFVGVQLLEVSHEVKLDGSCGWILADRIQVQQVLINLIRNAIQAMGEARRKQVVISSSCNVEGMVEISVADTGAGIAPEAVEALFSPFQSTKAEGMGIGLSISRTIVESHGGKIWAEDRPGSGAVFRFTLPRAEEPHG